MNANRSNARGSGRTAHRAAALATGPMALSFVWLNLAATGCANVDTPYTYAVIDNHYPASAAAPLVVYRAYWQSVAFTTPIPPGSSSAPATALPASANTAWVVLAPGWDPSSSSHPRSFVVLRSRSGLALDLDDTLHIPVGDADFAGNCATGAALSQDETDFITQLVFHGIFQGLHYDAATCATTPVADAETK